MCKMPLSKAEQELFLDKDRLIMNLLKAANGSNVWLEVDKSFFQRFFCWRGKYKQYRPVERAVIAILTRARRRGPSCSSPLTRRSTFSSTISLAILIRNWPTWLLGASLCDVRYYTIIGSLLL